MFSSDIITVPHGFFTKNEGRRIITTHLMVGKLLTLKQVHSNIVHYADDSMKEGVEGDAFVTDKPGIGLGIITADCGPVLLCDEKARVIGAAHAGWKGARAGILENTVQLMRDKGAKNIVAALGPCIKQRHYEVGAEFRDSFVTEDAANEKFFEAGVYPAKAGVSDKFLFDLGGYITKKLEQAGVEKIAVLPNDTLSDEQNFCSFRRTTLAGETDAGRQLSAICLT